MSWFIMLAIAEVGVSFLFIGLGRFVVGGWLPYHIRRSGHVPFGGYTMDGNRQRPVPPLGRPMAR